MDGLIGLKVIQKEKTHACAFLDIFFNSFLSEGREKTPSFRAEMNRASK